jgi:hypothetical protein
MYIITYHPKKDLALVGQIFVKNCHNYNKLHKNQNLYRILNFAWVFFLK